MAYMQFLILSLYICVFIFINYLIVNRSSQSGSNTSITNFFLSGWKITGRSLFWNVLSLHIRTVSNLVTRHGGWILQYHGKGWRNHLSLNCPIRKDVETPANDHHGHGCRNCWSVRHCISRNNWYQITRNNNRSSSNWKKRNYKTFYRS